MAVFLHHNSMSAANDGVNQRLADVEKLRNGGNSFAVCSHFSGQSDFFIADLGYGPEVEFHPLGVSHVPISVNPFKIGRNIVRLDRINMVDDGEVAWVWDECLRDESVNQEPFALSVLSQDDVVVGFLPSSSDKAWLSDLTKPSRTNAFSVYGDSVDTSDSAEVTDLETIFESFDGNWSPFLSESDIDSTGCPSGNSGSTIKDPSFVATFGGSAYYGGCLRVLQ